MNSLLLVANPSTAKVIEILNGLHSMLLGVLVALTVVMVAYAGFRYTVSAGDPQNVERAKSALRYALGGLCVGLLAQVAVSIVKGVIRGASS